MAAEKLTRAQRLLCALRGHGHWAGKGSTRLGATCWCLRCGTTFRSTYDGLSPGWRRCRELSFGEPEANDD